MVLLFALLGCGPDVTSMYAQERERALAVETGTPKEWSPDLTLAIGAPDLARATSLAATTALTGVNGKAPTLSYPLPLGLSASLTPDLEIRSLEVSPSGVCTACFAFEATLDGRGAWQLGPAKGSVPIGATAVGVLEVGIGDDRMVSGRVRDVTRLDVRSRDIGELRVNPDSELRAWLEEALGRAPAIRLAALKLDALPLRDLRLRTTTAGLSIEMLSDVPGALALTAHTAPTAGVQLAISGSVLSGLARRAAYQAGTLQMDIAADPRTIRVDGDRFEMDLRVWRLVGRGWYRDFAVAGTIRLDGGKLRLTADGATQVAESPGAGLVDPLAALFEGKILDAIVDSVDQALPARRNERVGGVTLAAEARSARGEGGDLVVLGTLTPSVARK